MKGERNKKKKFYFWPGAISIIVQQYNKTNKMISVPSKDSDQVGHLTSLNVTDFFTVGLWLQGTP